MKKRIKGQKVTISLEQRHAMTRWEIDWDDFLREQIDRQIRLMERRRAAFLRANEFSGESHD